MGLSNSYAPLPPPPPPPPPLPLPPNMCLFIFSIYICIRYLDNLMSIWSRFSSKSRMRFRSCRAYFNGISQYSCSLDPITSLPRQTPQVSYNTLLSIFKIWTWPAESTWEEMGTQDQCPSLSASRPGALLGIPNIPAVRTERWRSRINTSGRRSHMT